MRRLALCLCASAALGTPALAKPADPVRVTKVHTVLDAARIAAAYGSVTSMYRTVEHNRAVGGVPNSYHLHGRAIDVVRRPGVPHRQIDAALRSAGYVLLESLDEGDHSHFAFGTIPVPAQLGPAVVRYPAPPEPPGPQTPRVLADDHGTLRLDLPPEAPASGPAVP